MSENNGVSALQPGLPGFAPEPPKASQPEGQVPNAGMLPNITYLSCPLCYGKRQTQWGACSSCADPDPECARWMLERLSAEQIDFLRAYGHTLARQPVREYPYIEFYVDGDDGVWDEEAYEGWLIPPTKHWFASGEMRFGPSGNLSFVRYNPTGLLLRECLMVGAGAPLPSMYPPRSASGIEARSDETRSGSAEGESPVPTADAQGGAS